MAKRSVAVRISGQEYRIRSDADEERLQRLARHVDAAMTQVRERTGTVDTLGVAILTSLNLAREVLALKETLRELPGDGTGKSIAIEVDRVRALIELAESAVAGVGSGGSARHASSRTDVDLLSLDTGDDSIDAEDPLLGPMGDESDEASRDGERRAGE